MLAGTLESRGLWSWAGRGARQDREDRGGGGEEGALVLDILA